VLKGFEPVERHGAISISMRTGKRVEMKYRKKKAERKYPTNEGE
jgi:hypothetical protein